MTRARDLSNFIGSGSFSSTTFTATAGQTAFTIAHTQGFVQVFMNGLLLDETVDYTSNGSAITLTSAAVAGDEIEVVKYDAFSVGNALTQTTADTRYANITGDTFTGNIILPSEGGATTTNVQRGLAKAWAYNVLNANVTSTNAFNISSYSDPGVGRTVCTLTNAMDAADFPVVDGGTSAYPYQSKALTASTLQCSSVNSGGNFSDGGQNFVVVGDMA